MKRTKKIMKYLLILFVGLGLLSVILAYTYQEKIARYLFEEINKQIKTELAIKGFDMTFWSSFPKASVNFEDVTLKDLDDGNLIEAKVMSFQFSPLSILDDRVEVQRVVIENGALRIVRHRKGGTNYDIFPARENASSSSSSFGVALKEAILKDIELLYYDEATNVEVASLIQKGTFSGAFTNEKYDLQAEVHLINRLADVGIERYLVGTDIRADLDVMMDVKNQNYIFRKANFRINKNPLVLNGSIKQLSRDYYYDLLLTAPNGKLEGVIDLLPARMVNQLGDIKSKGNFGFELTYKGRSSKSKQPDIRAKGKFTNGSISTSKLNSPMKDVSFAITYDNIQKRSRFKLENVKGYLDGHQITGYLTTDGVNDDPMIKLGINGQLPLKAIYPLLGSPSITDGTGDIDLHDVTLKGRMSELTNLKKIHKAFLAGQIELDDAKIITNGQEVILDKGTLDLAINRIKISNVEIDGIGHEIMAEGEISNFLPAMLADSTDTRPPKVKINLNLSAKELDIKKLVTAFSTTNKDNEVTKNTSSLAAKSPNNTPPKGIQTVAGVINMAVKSFEYDLIHGKDFDGRIDLDGFECLIDGDADAMGGSFNLEGKIYLLSKPLLKADLTCNNVSIKQFFEQTKNFGQSVITAKSISGTLQSQMYIQAEFNEKGELDQDKLHVLADISIDNGELKELEMLENFATFIKINDLRHVKFTNLRNWLEIKNNRIFIPTMFIQSNAANLTVSGEHTFDQLMDYNISVNAGQILVNKFKRYNPDLTPKKAKKRGFLNLYFTIKGDADNYDIRVDKHNVRAALARAELQKADIKRRLVYEFGSEMSDDPSPNEVIEETVWEDSDLEDEQITMPTSSTQETVPVKKPTTKTAPTESSSEEEEFIDWED